MSEKITFRKYLENIKQILDDRQYNSSLRRKIFNDDISFQDVLRNEAYFREEYNKYVKDIDALTKWINDEDKLRPLRAFSDENIESEMDKRSIRSDISDFDTDELESELSERDSRFRNMRNFSKNDLLDMLREHYGVDNSTIRSMICTYFNLNDFSYSNDELIKMVKEELNK